ncbi:GntR family transcriptional regulator [Microbacterium arborescens]|uniref:GntR family transcriptional regulator n=1 Tax=Microbacterium arborescens TaxID=33883 RepID=UPI003C787F2E
MIAYSTLPWERIHDRAPLSLRLAALTAREIVEGRRPAGSWLTESDIADAGGASRTPAREAMLQLAGWRLVTIAPKKGAVVTAIGPSEYRELLDLRALLETNAVEQAVIHEGRLPTLGVNLEKTISRQRAAVEASDLLGFAAGDYAFHAQIIRSSGGSLVGEILDLVGPRFARLTHLAVSTNPGRIATLLDEHTALARYATDGDVPAFRKMIARHIEAGHQALAGAA